MGGGFLRSTGTLGTSVTWIPLGEATSWSLLGVLDPGRMGLGGRQVDSWAEARGRFLGAHEWDPPLLSLSLSLYAVLTVLPPKGPDDVDWAVRPAAPCRPLPLRNTDSKVIAAAVIQTLSPVLAREAHNAQHGFVRCCQLSYNKVEIDVCARDGAAQARFSAQRDPLLALFYVRATFLSVAHGFLWDAMEFYSYPAGCVALVESLYVGACALTEGEGTPC